ncbi:MULTISPECIES: S-layer homology domain-containing protein [Oscillospiraceae]|uniref:S-layer homology domain-containing protein n=1 Tax=Oscillospiraceae TaxID=216572 RepID=UPI0030B881D1
MDETAWYYDGVAYVYEKGLMTGTGDGSTLTPQGQATRAQAAVLLMRWQEALS